jgi:hypothetical protein
MEFPPLPTAPAVLLAGLLAAGGALAGGPPEGAVPPGQALDLGRFQFRPFASVSYGYDSNIFNLNEILAPLTAGGILADDFVFVDTSLALRLPFSQSYAELVYRPSYLDYSEFQLDENVSQGADAVVDLLTGSGTEIGLSQSFDRGFIKTNEVDPGGETVFRAQRYQSLTTRLDLQRDVRPDLGYRVNLFFSDVNFDQETTVGLFDYRVGRLTAAAGRRLNRGVMIEGIGDLTAIRRFRPLAPELDLSTDEETQSIDAIGLGMGARWQGNQENLFIASLLVTRLEADQLLLERATGPGEIRRTTSRYTGPDFELRWINASAGRSRRELLVAYGPLQSFFLNNAYYLSFRGTFRYQLQITSRVRFNGSLDYYDNRYPESIGEDAPPVYEPWIGLRRKDTFVELDLGLAFPLVSHVTLVIGGTRGERDSNISIQGFDFTRLYTRLELGWP